MKHIYLFGAAVMLAVCGNAQDGVPSQIKTVRARYDAAVKTALDPIRLRYLEELSRMRANAMSQKNLDLANAIDAEINNVAPEMRTTGGLANTLAGTTWSWGKSLASAGSILRFVDAETYKINDDLPGKWSVVNGTTIKLDNGSTLRFDRAHDTYEGATAAGEPRVGRKR